MEINLYQPNLELPIITPPWALTRLAELIVGPAQPSQLILLQESNQLSAFVNEVRMLSSEASMHIYGCNTNFTPDTLINKCHLIVRLLEIVRVYQTMGGKLAFTYQQIAGSIESMSLFFHGHR